MTNKELQKLFQELLAKSNNIFDCYEQLGSINKEYRMSDFYKHTKKSIYDAFELYMKTLGSVDYLITLFKNVGDDDLMNIAKVLEADLDFNSIMNQLDPSNKKLFAELLPHIK